MKRHITVEALQDLLLSVPYDTAMDADGNLYIRGNLICNIITLLQENNGMSRALETLTNRKKFGNFYITDSDRETMPVTEFAQAVLDDPIGWIR